MPGCCRPRGQTPASPCFAWPWSSAAVSMTRNYRRKALPCADFSVHSYPQGPQPPRSSSAAPSPGRHCCFCAQHGAAPRSPCSALEPVPGFQPELTAAGLLHVCPVWCCLSRCCRSLVHCTEPGLPFSLTLFSLHGVEAINDFTETHLLPPRASPRNP